MILLCVTLHACATPAPQRIADSACTAFRPISYAQAPRGADGQRTTADPENRYDSDETVGEVEGHNAKWDALCAADRGGTSPRQ